MKKLILAGAALCAATVPGFAADLPSRTAPPAPAPAYVAPPPVFSWTGFYVGLNGGYNLGKVNSPSGWFGTTNGWGIGATAGYNYQVNQFVVGVEGDIDWLNARRTLTFAGPLTTTASVRSLGTARVRLGYAIDRTLLYVTGGYAGGNEKATIADTPNALAVTSSAYRNGYALGAGVEYALTNQISLKGEYLYTQLQKKTVFAAPDLTTAGYRDSGIRFGVNYHF